MGTRNLACVVKNGEYKLARYCQWDGYPSGQGRDILEFLRNDFDRTTFEVGLANIKEVTTAQLKQFWTDCGADPKCDWVTLEISEKFKTVYPELSRDPNHASILKGIQTGTVQWSNPELNFVSDSLFCEWCYVIDLDKGTFEIYKGFNKSPLAATERFANMPLVDRGQAEQYYPCRFVKSYSLRRLPSLKTFLRDVDKKNK
jgi:hypothetical protein